MKAAESILWLLKFCLMLLHCYVISMLWPKVSYRSSLNYPHAMTEFNAAVLYLTLCAHWNRLFLSCRQINGSKWCADIHRLENSIGLENRKVAATGIACSKEPLTDTLSRKPALVSLVLSFLSYLLVPFSFTLHMCIVQCILRPVHLASWSTIQHHAAC